MGQEREVVPYDATVFEHVENQLWEAQVQAQAAEDDAMAELLDMLEQAIPSEAL
jgi:hypothetical protein